MQDSRSEKGSPQMGVVLRVSLPSVQGGFEGAYVRSSATGEEADETTQQLRRLRICLRPHGVWILVFVGICAGRSLLA